MAKQSQVLAVATLGKESPTTTVTILPRNTENTFHPAREKNTYPYWLDTMVSQTTSLWTPDAGGNTHTHFPVTTKVVMMYTQSHAREHTQHGKLGQRPEFCLLKTH